MAINIQSAKKKMGLTGLLTFLVIAGILAAAAYYMFFAPTPGFETIVPSDLKRTQTISTFDLDPKSVFNSPQFKALDKYNGLPTGGTFGRENPFLGF